MSINHFVIAAGLIIASSTQAFAAQQTTEAVSLEPEAAELMLKSLPLPASALGSISSLLPPTSDELLEQSENTVQESERSSQQATPKVDPNTPSFAHIPATAKVMQVDSQLTLAEVAIDTGDNERAIKLLTRTVHNQPQHRGARLMLARLQTLHGSSAQAISTLKPLLKSGDPDWQAWFWAGTGLLLSGKIEAARAALAQASTYDATRASVWVQRAVIEQQGGQPQQALAMLNIARELNQKAPAVHLNIAYSNEHISDIAGAIAAYRKFLATSTGWPEYAEQRETALSRLARLVELQRSTARPKPAVGNTSSFSTEPG